MNMDMEWSHVHVSQPGFAKLIVIFCFLWPFLAFGYLRMRARSSVPIAAMLVTFAVAAAGTWLYLYQTIRGMAISGGGRASTAAGTAEALAMVGVGAWSALFVGIVALLRRHRPVADRPVVVFAALVLADVTAAMLFARSLAPLEESFFIAYTGAAVSVAIAAGAASWLFFVARGRVTPRPVPFGAVAILLACLITGFFVWQRVQAHVAIAMYG